MSHRNRRWLALGFFLALLISGCKCSESQIDIMEIILDSPAAGEAVSSLLPSLIWHNSESCQPDSYRIYVKENSEYSGGHNYTTPDGNPSLTLTGAPLEPGKEYIWKAEAVRDGYGHSSWSEYSIFYTGPVCSGEALIVGWSMNIILTGPMTGAVYRFPTTSSSPGTQHSPTSI
jgi:hypothetical protein